MSLFYRVNTFGPKIKVGKDVSGNSIYHPVHEYNDTLKNIYLDDFLSSEANKATLAEMSGKNKKVSYTKFLDGAKSCPCIREPTMRVCVDEIETGFTEMTLTLKNILFSSKQKGQVCKCGFCESEAKKKEEYGSGMYAIVDEEIVSFLILLLSNVYRIYPPFVQLSYANEASPLRKSIFSVYD